MLHHTNIYRCQDYIPVGYDAVLMVGTYTSDKALVASIFRADG
jgi:hypothetical protein